MQSNSADERNSEVVASAAIATASSSEVMLLQSNDPKPSLAPPNAEEEAACILIQRRTRAMLEARRLEHRNASSTKIQRVYRGFRGRKLALCLRLENHESRKERLFNQVARTIQRYFRGHCSRQNVFNLASRRKFVTEASSASDRVRAESERYAKEMAEARKLAIVEAAYQKACHQYRNKHHLISTKCIPGALCSPLWVDQPAVEGLPLEPIVRRASLPKPLSASVRLSSRVRQSIQRGSGFSEGSPVLGCH